MIKNFYLRNKKKNKIEMKNSNKLKEKELILQLSSKEIQKIKVLKQKNKIQTITIVNFQKLYSLTCSMKNLLYWIVETLQHSW